MLIILLVIVTVLSPPSRGAWIEMQVCKGCRLIILSPPSRGAWIEIGYTRVYDKRRQVAPLAGGVD